MKKTESTGSNHGKWKLVVPILCAALLGLTGCRAGGGDKSKSNFFTSGSREADQRATQKMAQAEQLSGNGEGAGEKNKRKEGASGDADKAPKAEGKLSLFDRLGGQVGISNIVVDFTPRALDDPRVNWERKGVKRGFLGGKAVTWPPTPANVAVLQQHMVQFIALATGGPPQYTGKDIKGTHADMHISNPEFDAVIGDLKASLDKLQVPNTEQKELLAIIESTRPLIVTER